MASRIKAIGALRPRIDLGKTVQKAELTKRTRSLPRRPHQPERRAN